MILKQLAIAVILTALDEDSRFYHWNIKMGFDEYPQVDGNVLWDAVEALDDCGVDVNIGEATAWEVGTNKVAYLGQTL